MKRTMRSWRSLPLRPGVNGQHGRDGNRLDRLALGNEARIVAGLELGWQIILFKLLGKWNRQKPETLRPFAPHERIERFGRDEDHGRELVALGHLGKGDRVWHELRSGLIPSRSKMIGPE